jgi:hypothetical protein
MRPEGGFLWWGSELSRLAEKRADVIPTAHSAVKNEKNKSELNADPDLSSPLACAYAFNIGEITHIAGRNKSVQRLSTDEYRSLFGPFTNSENVEFAAEANRKLSVAEFGDEPRKFAITRSQLLSTGMPTMLLHGDHAHSADTFLLANFSQEKLTDPSAAQEIGRPYYAIDFTHAAETIIKSLPEARLDPEILLAAMLLDVCATRAALAAHDGPANPERIALVRYGDPEQALEYLRNLQL